MKHDHTAEDVVRRIESELAAGKKTRAKAIIRLTTNLDTNETREVVEGQRKVQPEEVTCTDLDNLNKAGCSVGSAPLLLGASCIAYFLT